MSGELVPRGALFESLDLTALNLAHQVAVHFIQRCPERASAGFTVQRPSRNLETHPHENAGSAVAWTFHHHFGGRDRCQTLPAVDVLLDHVMPGIVNVEIRKTDGGLHACSRWTSEMRRAFEGLAAAETTPGVRVAVPHRRGWLLPGNAATRISDAVSTTSDFFCRTSFRPEPVPGYGV